MSSLLTSIAVNGSLAVNINPNVATLGGNMILSDQTNLTLTPGSGVGQADGAFTMVGSVTAGTPVTIDLTTLKDPFGNTLTAGHLVALKATNTSNSSSGTLALGGGTNPIFAAMPSALAITPGDFCEQSFNGAGLPVVAASTQYLTLTASTGTVTYKLSGLVRSL